MAITKALIPASIASGLDTDTDPKLGPKGLTRIEDGVYKRAGVISKRFGTTEIGAYNEEWLTQYDDIAILHGTNHQVRVFDGTDFDLIDYIGYSTIETEPISSKAGVTTNALEVALQGSVFLSVYASNENPDGSGIYARTYDSATDRPLYFVDLDGYSNAPSRCIATDSGLFIISVDGNFSALVYRSVNTTTGEISSAGRLDALNGSIKQVGAGFRDELDICYIGGTNQTIAISYISGTGTPSLVLFKTTEALAAYYTEPHATSGAHHVACYKQQTDEVITIAYDEVAGPTHNIFAVGTDNVGNQIITEAELWSSVTATDVIINLAGVASSTTIGTVYWTFEDQTIATPTWDMEVQYNTFENSGGTGTVGTITDFKMGAKIYSKPWYDSVSENTYIVLIPDNGHSDLSISSQWTYVVLQQGTQMFGKFLINKGYYTNFPTNVQDVDGWVTFGALQSESIFDNVPESVGQARVLIATSAQNVVTAETEDVLVFPGSMPYEFDGQQTYEQGFITFPHLIDSVLNGAGNLTVDKTYSYVALYEWTDRKGNRHQSSPSPADTFVTSAGNTKTIVTIPTLTFTKRASVQIVLYRTTGNGSIWYRCLTSGNSSLVGSVNIEDNVSDSDLSSQETLYTTGGILENIQPPQFNVQTLYQNRHFVVDADRPEVLIRYSKPIDKGFGVEHSDTLTLECNADGGKITALVEYQDRLLIFKENRIYMTYGAGLDNFGTGSNYYDPSLLSNTVGCTNPKAILQTPQGVVFPASDNNFYLLNRKLLVSAFGDPVDHWHDSSAITGGAVMPEQDQVIWMNNDADGYAVVFNWHFGMWSTWSEFQGTDAMFYNDADYLMFKKNDGSVWRQTEAYPDAGSGNSAPMKLETGWYSFTGIAGFSRLKRIMIVGQNLNAHVLNIKVGYDFDPTWVDEETYDTSGLLPFDVTEYYGNGLGSAYVDQSYMIEVPTSRQKITSVRVHISDVPNVGAAYEIAGIVFEIGKKSGPVRVGSDRVQGT